MLKLRIKFNFHMMLRIKKIKISFTTSSKPIKVQIEGFDIVFITMNEFEEWQEKKLKLLHMLEDISAKIRTLLMRKEDEKPQRQPFEEDKAEDINTNSTRSNVTENEKVQDDANTAKKGYIIKLIFKFIYSLDLSIKEGKVRFLVFKNEDLNVTAANIKDFFYKKLDNEEFLTKYECFTINSHDWVIIDISPNTEYEIIVSINAPTVMLSNTCYPNSHSIAEELRLTLRIPPGKELMKNV